MTFLSCAASFLTAANLALFLWALAWCSRDIAAAFPRQGKWVYGLAGILAGTLAIHLAFVSLKHAVFYDEFYYMDAAFLLRDHGYALGYGKGLGWPLLMALLPWHGGMQGYEAMALSAGLSILAAVNVFLLSYLLTRSGASACLAAALFSFFPAVMFWSSTAETAGPALFFSTLSMLAFFLYCRDRSPRLLWLFLMSMAFTVQVRPEQAALLACCGLAAKGYLRQGVKGEAAGWIPWAVAALFIGTALSRGIIHLFSYARLSAESGGALTGNNVSIANLAHNTVAWGGAFFDGRLYPLCVAALFLAGMWRLWKAERPHAVFITSWFLVLFVTYFSSWLQVYGTSTALFPKTKIFLYFYPVIALACGFAYPCFMGWWGGKWGRVAMAALAACAFGFGAMYYKDFPMKDRVFELETSTLSRLAALVGKDALLVAQERSVARPYAGMRVATCDQVLESRQAREWVFSRHSQVFFLDDFSYRTYAPDGVKEAMAATFAMEPVEKFTRPYTEPYVLYRLKEK